MRQIEFLGFAAETLERLGIPYAVVGSYASTAWGDPRMTRDIDIVISPTAQQVDLFMQAFPAPGFYVSSTAAHEAVRHRGQFNVIQPATGNKIDFIVAKDGEWPAAQLARREKIQFMPGVSAYVATPEDVILGKLIYYREGGSEKHLRDIRGIFRVLGPDIDYEYLQQLADQLGIGDILQTAIEKNSP